MSTTRVPSETRATRNGQIDGKSYDVAFYPGWVSRVAVRRGGTSETEIYNQKSEKEKGNNIHPFNLPEGQEKRQERCTFEFSGGPHGKAWGLEIHDPHDAIARIEVTLKAPAAGGNGAGGVRAMQQSEPTVIVLDDTAVLCPPMCETGG